MRAVSKAYREAMQLHRTKGFRNQMYAEVYLGLIDDTAKDDSAYQVAGEIPYSSHARMYNDRAAISKTSYSTFERDTGLVLGREGGVLLPRKEDVLAQGYVSLGLSDEGGIFQDRPFFDFTFGKRHGIVGLTLQFDPRVGMPPTDFVVTTYYQGELLDTREVSGNTEYDAKPELGLDNFDRLRIEFVKSGPYQRVHLNRITFGIGYVFTGDELISIKQKRANHPLSMSLPVNELQFALFNEDGRFNVDSGNSVVRFLRSEQKITLKYGCDVDGHGSIEWLDAGYFYLNTWETKGFEATFSAKDIFKKLSQTKYKKGVFDAREHSLAELAESVLLDAGIDSFYVGDDYAQNTTTILPLPYTSHAENLQLLANHACSTLEQDPTAKIVMRQRVLVPVEEWALSTLPEGDEPPMLPFSDIRTAVDDSPLTEYATWEKDFFVLGSAQKMLARTGGHDPAGAVFNVFPQEDGNYRYPEVETGVPGLCMDFTRNVTFGQLEVELSDYSEIDKLLVMAERPGGAMVVNKTYAVQGNSIVLHEYFDNVVRIYVCPLHNNRPHRSRVKKVKISLQTGLVLTHDDVLGNAKGELMPACKDVMVLHQGVWFYEPGYSEELMRAKVMPGDLTEVKHSDVYYYVHATCEDSRVRIDVAEHYAFCSFLKVSGVAEETEIILTGAPYSKVAERYETRHMNDGGQDAEFENPTVKEQLAASNMADWAQDYYAKREEYEVDVLGYPDCDAGDVILYDGKPATVLENTIDFKQGAMRGKMLLRG